MKNNIYKSILKDRLFNFINFKQEQDYKYENQIYGIKAFDDFLLQTNYNKQFLTMEIVNGYTISFQNKAPKSKQNRFSILKEFSIYLKMFENESYQIRKNIFRSPPRKKSYIYSDREIDQLLNAFKSHKYKHKGKSSLANYTILGVLIFTGLRIQECLNININQWDQENKTIFIKEGKFGKDRLIPIDKSVNDKLKEYYKKRIKLKSIDEDEPLFINSNLKRVKQDAFRNLFNVKIKELNIGKNSSNCREPKIHSLRHSFAVKTLLKWVEAGKNCNDMLPYLSTYMGHISLESTQVYLQSVKELDKIEYKKFYQTFKNNI